MRKIAIITLIGYSNYGNRLQNYALQEVLKSYGFNVETIISGNSLKNYKKVKLLDRLRNMKGKSAKEICKKIEHKLWIRLNQKEIFNSNEIRTKIFKEFTNNHIKESGYTILNNNIPHDLSDRYEYFVTGSDQVWNPDYNYGSSFNFLNFAEKHKRLTYAPSFGVSEIKAEYIENYKEWISEIHRLSVREDDGAKIIKELTGRDAPVLVDPTLLLTKQKWLSIAKEARNKPEGKYLLTYFLGGVPEYHKKQIENLAKENDLAIINLGDIREKETYRTGPSEFINYINTCKIFCTDSFHGVVFSVLFEKTFIVYERMGTSLTMFSRINTLLNKFNLESRKVENIKTIEEIFDIDYSHIPAILEEERKKAFNYVKEALNI